MLIDQVNLVVRDLDATVAFYRLLGLGISDSGDDWPPGSGQRHVEVDTAGGPSLEFDNAASASVWHGGATVSGTKIVIGFALASRDAVDTAYAELLAAGAVARREPYDAFWGARYAIVVDLDGNDIGLMSPKDPARRYTPDAR